MGGWIFVRNVSNTEKVIGWIVSMREFFFGIMVWCNKCLAFGWRVSGSNDTLKGMGVCHAPEGAWISSKFADGCTTKRATSINKSAYSNPEAWQTCSSAATTCSWICQKWVGICKGNYSHLLPCPNIKQNKPKLPDQTIPLLHGAVIPEFEIRKEIHIKCITLESPSEKPSRVNVRAI